MRLRKGDRVKVIAGKDKGVVGEVIAVHPEDNRVVVQGVNIMKRHVRDTADPRTGRTTKGGLLSSEAPIHASTAQLVTKDAAGNEVLTRVGYERAEVTKRRSDGSEYEGTRAVRVSRKTGREICWQRPRNQRPTSRPTWCGPRPNRPRASGSGITTRFAQR